MWANKHCAAFVIILCLLSACNLLAPAGDPPSTTINVTTVPSDESITSRTDVQTYVDTLAGFAFDYPAGWTITPPPSPEAIGYAITLASYDFLANPDPAAQRGAPDWSQNTKIDIYVVLAGMTQAELQEQLDAEIAAGNFRLLSDEQRTYANGLSARHFRGRDFFDTEYATVWVEVNERLLSIAVFGDDSALDLIVGSLRVAGA